MLAQPLNRILAEPIGSLNKAFPPGSGDLPVASVAEQGWNVLAGDLLLPALVLKESALAHNLEAMASFCREHGVDIAPHGKTTMAPQIVWRQLDAGAWAITAATTSQVMAFRSFAVPRVVLANEVVEPRAIAWLSAELDADPAFDLYLLADSPAAVAALAGARGTRFTRPLQVLVELGFAGGRTGCRTIEQAVEVARAVVEAPGLELAGVEGYEGIIHAERDADAIAAVDRFLSQLRELAERLLAERAFEGRDEVVVTTGGSAFFDRVVEELAGLAAGADVRVVLRSGCYVTHDSGFYERLSPLAGRGSPDGRLRAALEVWGVVLSRPEPELVIAGMGKRDVAYDLELPIPLAVHDADGLRTVAGEFASINLNDQHLYVRVAAGDPVAVGDLLGCGISHPCTAFDKWRLIPVVDDEYSVVDAYRTFF